MMPRLVAALVIAPALAFYPPWFGQLSPESEMHQTSVTFDDIQPEAACTDDVRLAKKYDIAVFGATGVVGGMAAEYLARHPEGPTFLLAGRSKEKLDNLMSRLSRNMSRLFAKSFDWRHNNPAGVAVANLNNYDSLAKIAKDARVVLTFASPYDDHNGEAMIRAAIENCAHYVDISGETVWRANMMKAYGSLAAGRGIAVVQGAGFSISMFADYLASAAALNLGKKGLGPPKTVNVQFNRMNGIPGGTAFISSKYAVQRYGQVRDPYIFSPETPASLRVDTELDGMVHPVYQSMPGMMWYPAARMDAPLVRRSMHRMFPAAAISVKHAQTNQLDASLKVYTQGMTKPFMQMGEAPSGEVMKSGGFDGEAVARGHGLSSRVIAQGQGDPGYTGSSKASVELAIGLAKSGPAGGKGGYLTPATALGVEALGARLTAIDNGSFMTVQHLDR